MKTIFEKQLRMNRKTSKPWDMNFSYIFIRLFIFFTNSISYYLQLRFIIFVLQKPMLSVIFGQVTLTKSAKYLLLIVTSSQTKRTNISEWTSNPSFNELELDSSTQSIVLKVCEATSDRKLKIVGLATIKIQPSTEQQVLFEGEVKLEQEVQGERICVGICYLTIRKAIQFYELQLKQPPPNAQAVQTSQAAKQSDDELEEQESGEPNEELRIQFHCGFGFYLGSQFRIEAEWGKETYRTQSVKDKINPVWSQSACLSGLAHKKLQIKVCDHKNNILQNIKIETAQLRVMFPYHLRIKFKDEFMGANPEVFLSIVRQTYPLFAITEIPVRFQIRSLAQLPKPLTCLIVSLNKELRFPEFIDLNLSKLTSLQLINKHINSRSVGEQDRIDLVGMPTPQTAKSFSILKSYLNRKLYFHLFNISDLKSAFCEENSSSLRLIQFKADFQSTLRRIYYNSQTFTLKKHLQISNPHNELQKVDSEATAQERWKVLSNNYVLRNNIVISTKQHIQNLRKAIQAKGQQIVQLKKVVIAVRNINNSLTAKQKLMNSIKSKKVRYNAKQITNEDLITALIGKQSELQEKKKINSELALRMDCLADVHQNQEDLTAQLIENSKELQEQQEKLKKMRFMQQALQRQRDMIGQLEKMFERKEIDKRVNQALKQQSEKLREIKEKKQNNLMKVYNTVKQQAKEGGSLAARIKRAEQTLINLNEQYARMVAL